MVAASKENGLVYWDYTVGRGFKKEDVMDFLGALRNKYKNLKFAVFLDNAKIHDNEAVRARAYDLDIPLIFNMKYRPEFNGIENLWLHTKSAYKKHVTGCRFRGESWDNVALSKQLLEDVDEKTIVEGLMRGYRNMENAKPIKKRKAEAEQDKMKDLIKAFDASHIDPDYVEEDQPQDEEESQELVGEERARSNDSDDWEPMPLDNLPKEARETAGVKDPAHKLPKRKARNKAEEFIEGLDEDEV